MRTCRSAVSEGEYDAPLRAAQGISERDYPEASATARQNEIRMEYPSEATRPLRRRIVTPPSSTERATIRAYASVLCSLHAPQSPCAERSPAKPPPKHHPPFRTRHARGCLERPTRGAYCSH